MLKNKLFNQIVNIKKFVESLNSIQFYNEASYLAIDGYKRFFTFIYDNFDYLEKSNYQTLYLRINQFIVPNLRFIERSTTNNVPWSLISNLDKVLKKEFGNDYYLLYRPQWRFNYSVLTTDLIDFLKNFLKLFFPLQVKEIDGLFDDKKIHIFSFPYLEKSNVLLNSIIGHEIGHFHHNNWKETSGAKRIVRNHTTELTKYYNDLYPTELFKSYESTEEGLKILSGMYREIISDIYGYYIFGPSMIFSLYYLSSLETKMNIPSVKTNYYPITKYRIRILMDYFFYEDPKLNKLRLKEDDFNTNFNLYIKEIEDYLKVEDDLNLLKTKKKEIDLFEDSIAELIKYFENQVNHNKFEAKNPSELFRKLENYIPINEFENEPIDIASIIFIGWIYHYKIDNKYTRDEYYHENRTLMKLLMKSLFSTYVHQEYEIHKNEQKL